MGVRRGEGINIFLFVLIVLFIQVCFWVWNLSRGSFKCIGSWNFSVSIILFKKKKKTLVNQIYEKNDNLCIIYRKN